MTPNLHFLVPVWGQRYRDYLTDFCLPSLMSPGNLPILSASDGHRLCFATTPADWEALTKSPILEAISRYATPTFLEIPDPQAAAASDNEVERYASSIHHMGQAYRLLLDQAKAARACAFVMNPDLIFSDGSVARVLAAARSDVDVLFCVAMRQVEEDVLAALARDGKFSKQRFDADEVRVLTLSADYLSRLSVECLHPEIFQLEFGYAPDIRARPYVYWREPNGGDLLIRALYALPIMMRMSIVPEDHTAPLLAEEYENVYYSHSFANSRRMEVIADSAELSILSLTPRSVNWTAPAIAGAPGPLRRFQAMCGLRESVRTHVMRRNDDVRLKIFDTPVRWRRSSTDEDWTSLASRVARLARNLTADVRGGAASKRRASIAVLTDICLSLRTKFFRTIGSLADSKSPFLANAYRAGRAGYRRIARSKG